MSANANILNATTIGVLLFVLVATLLVFFGWTCTAGTFDSNTFNVSNCFIVPGLFTSNVAVTSPTLAPDAACDKWNVFNCPTTRCQVDEVQGVCEELGSDLMKIECTADEYQTALTCPYVGCEWNADEEKCAGIGEHCSYQITKSGCETRQDCQWDKYRPVYAMCIPTTKSLSPVDCRVIYNEDECTEDPECVYYPGTDEVAAQCLNTIDDKDEKCRNCVSDDIRADTLYGFDTCPNHATQSTCNAAGCCAWVSNEAVCVPVTRKYC